MRIPNIYRVGIVAVFLAFSALLSFGNIYAADNSEFRQEITAGTLETDIKDDTQAAVANPFVNFSSVQVSVACETTTAAFGANDQRIYVTNPNAADDGWTLTMAATSGAASLWEDGANNFDFNDPAGSGCDEGQLSVDPTAGTLTADCDTCDNTDITLGSSTAFNQGTVDSITLINAASTSDNNWRGYLTGADLSQTIPAATPSGNYTLDMTLTATTQ